jgi:tol-pal system protein YbgF
MTFRGMRPFGFALLTACAAAPGTPLQDPSGGNADRLTSIERLEQRAEEQAGRIAELEARLALLETEARDTRAASLRLGGAGHHDGGALDGARAKLAGERALPWAAVADSASSASSTPAPQPVVGAPAERLPVVPLPDAPSARAHEPAAAVVRERYRVALRLVRERRWEQALPALSEFLVRHPHDGLSDNARYWRGEVYYAQARYPEAILEFQGVLARFPGSDKAADCLLKVGMCHLRLGDRAQASRYFEQLKEQFPKSDAARAASREGPA